MVPSISVYGNTMQICGLAARGENSPVYVGLEPLSLTMKSFARRVPSTDCEAKHTIREGSASYEQQYSKRSVRGGYGSRPVIEAAARDRFSGCSRIVRCHHIIAFQHFDCKFQPSHFRLQHGDVPGVYLGARRGLRTEWRCVMHNRWYSRRSSADVS